MRLAAVFAAAFVVALATVAASDREAKSRVGKDEALRAALADAGLRKHLRSHPYDRTRITPLDDRSQRVTFFDGPRVVADAAVAPGPRVEATLEYRPGYVRSGSKELRGPAILLLLTGVFGLATLTRPLRSLHNLDVAALGAATIPIILLNERLFEWSVWPGFALLVYLAARCALVAASRSRGAAAAGEPLLGAEHERILRYVTAGTGAALVVLTLTSTGVSDVAFASLAGATKFLDGDLPYGALTTDVVHGDTYPPLAYLFYAPGALALPVRDAFDNLDGGLWVCLAAALATAAAFHRLGGRRGLLAFLAYPPVLVTTTSGANDMVLAALVAWALVLFARPGSSSLLLALGGWVKLIPLVVFPVWLARFRGAGLGSAAAAFAGVSGGVLVLVVALGGTGGISDMLDAISFQFERGSLLSFWSLTGWKWLQLGLQAVLLASIVAATLAVWRDQDLADDRRRMAGLVGALMIGFQLTANYWTHAYLPWVLPFVAVALLFPERGKGLGTSTAGN